MKTKSLMQHTAPVETMKIFFIPDKKQLFSDWQLISEEAFRLRNQRACYKEETQKQPGDRIIGGKRISASMCLPIIEIGNIYFGVFCIWQLSSH